MVKFNLKRNSIRKILLCVLALFSLVFALNYVTLPNRIVIKGKTQAVKKDMHYFGNTFLFDKKNNLFKNGHLFGESMYLYNIDTNEKILLKSDNRIWGDFRKYTLSEKNVYFEKYAFPESTKPIRMCNINNSNIENKIEKDFKEGIRDYVVIDNKLLCIDWKMNVQGDKKILYKLLNDNKIKEKKRVNVTKEKLYWQEILGVGNNNIYFYATRDEDQDQSVIVKYNYNNDNYILIDNENFTYFDIIVELNEEEFILFNDYNNTVYLVRDNKIVRKYSIKSFNSDSFIGATVRGKDVYFSNDKGKCYKFNVKTGKCNLIIDYSKQKKTKIETFFCDDYIAVNECNTHRTVFSTESNKSVKMNLYDYDGKLIKKATL